MFLWHNTGNGDVGAGTVGKRNQTAMGRPRAIPKAKGAVLQFPISLVLYPSHTIPEGLTSWCHKCHGCF